jgi:hypothetical protein
MATKFIRKKFIRKQLAADQKARIKQQEREELRRIFWVSVIGTPIVLWAFKVIGF